MAPPFSGVVVGEVLERRPAPECGEALGVRGDHDGTDRLQIMCGASNVRGGSEGGGRHGRRASAGRHAVIKRAKLRGLESNGMLCSARELGLGDEHEGILELPASIGLRGGPARGARSRRHGARGQRHARTAATA